MNARHSVTVQYKQRNPTWLDFEPTSAVLISLSKRNEMNLLLQPRMGVWITEVLQVNMSLRLTSDDRHANRETMSEHRLTSSCTARWPQRHRHAVIPDNYRYSRNSTFVYISLVAAGSCRICIWHSFTHETCESHSYSWQTSTKYKMARTPTACDLQLRLSERRLHSFSAGIVHFLPSTQQVIQPV